MKISGIYKITNTVTGDFYIGSSKNVKRRWNDHKRPSRWKEQPNNPMYQDMNKYGVNSFVFEVLAEVEEGSLKEVEQQFIEKYNPIYNQMNAKGLNIERRKESNKKFEKSDKRKEYNKSNKRKEYYKEYHKEHDKEYYNQLCFYNGQTITLNALRMRFWRQGIENPTIEAKKYLLQ